MGVEKSRRTLSRRHFYVTWVLPMQFRTAYYCFFLLLARFSIRFALCIKRMVTLVDLLHPSQIGTEFFLSRCDCARYVYLHDFLHLSLFLSCLLLSKFDQDNNQSRSSSILLGDFFPAYDKNHTHAHRKGRKKTSKKRL